MIIPCPENLREYSKYPLTITLALLNIFIFILIFDGGSSSLYGTSRVLSEDGLVLTGRLYYQYLQNQPPEELYAKPSWMMQMRSQDKDHLLVMGSYALRDSKFLEGGELHDFRGDDVEISQWKKDFVEFRREYKEQMLYRFGLSSIAPGSLSWVTYQFSHSSWLHLFSNLVFLIVMGAAVEALAGSGPLLLIYVFGGFAGGIGFLMSQYHGTVPMVGASASISALLAFYCVAEAKKRVRYFFFVAPMMGQDGFLYLPTLLIFPLFLLVDLGSFWSTPEGLGSGVAYAAHLGGTVFGLIAGALYRAKNAARTSSSFSETK